MDAKGKSFSFLKTEQIYKIPFFQRSYVWDEDNWKEILENLISDDGIFLGSIIMKSENNYAGEISSYSVIDGQQRLTTISILLKVISQTLADDIATKLNFKEFLFTYDISILDDRIKIVHSKLDTEPYNEVINGKVTERKLNFITNKSHKILRCYKYFYNILKDFSNEKILKIYRNLINENNQAIVLITLNENDNEQAIFDTINNAGIKLTSADTIKNAIFQKALDLAGNDHSSRKKVIDLYEKTWENEFSGNEEKALFWDKERRSGRIMRTNLEIFLYCFAVIKGIYNPNMHKMENLSTKYKEFIKLLKYEELFKLIQEIDDYAVSYYTIFDDYDNLKSISFDEDYSRLLLVLDKFDVSTFHPYILYVITNYPFEESKRRLELLEKYIIRNMVAPNRNAKNYNKECYSLIHDENIGVEKFLNIPELSNDEIEKGLHNINNKTASIILFLIELKRRFNSNADIKSLIYNYSLEHIMPQSWEEHWSINLLPVYDVEKDEIINDKLKAEKIRNDNIYSIGNMTLLNKALNSSLKNNEFSRKILGNPNENKSTGIKDLSDLFITKIDIVRVFTEGDKVWDERKIIKREKALSAEFFSIW